MEPITNTPCTCCGSTEIPLHTDGVCGDCHLEGMIVGVMSADLDFDHGFNDFND